MALRFEIKKKKIIPTLTGSDATNIPVPMFVTKYPRGEKGV